VDPAVGRPLGTGRGERLLRRVLAGTDLSPSGPSPSAEGDGPLRQYVVETARSMPNVEYLGPRTAAETQALVGDAAVLVFPSECYETFGLVMVEAFARGTPVIAADMGGIREIVEPGRTGLVFAPGDATDLATRVEQALGSPETLVRMGCAARQVYEQRYTADRAYADLMRVYAEVNSTVWAPN